jgi:hypothetical protein
MKLNMKFLKNILKIGIILFIVIYCIYVLYFSSNVIYENFANVSDCSNCNMKPSIGNCEIIYDLSYITNAPDGSKPIDVSYIDSGLRFCKWEQNCDMISDYKSNIISAEERILLDNDEIKQKGGENFVQCCSGSTFFNTNNINFNEITQVGSNKTRCGEIETYLADIDPEYSYDLISRLGSICKNVDNSNTGMLFDTSTVSVMNILEDPDLTVEEIIALQNTMEVRMIKVSPVSGGNPETRSHPRIQELNTELKSLDRDSVTFDTRKLSIQKDLAQLFISTFLDKPITDATYEYKLVDKNHAPIMKLQGVANNPYILNENQFLNCGGEIRSIDVTKKYGEGEMSEEERAIFDSSDNIDYFGTHPDADYTTMQDGSQRFYPNKQDLEMELLRLEKLTPGGNAPVGVINSYLSAINSFYEKQIKNLIGPKTHSFNQEMDFNEATQETTKPTFFVYEHEPNNEYECQESITGNPKFQDCGPNASYSEFKS